MWIGHLSPNNLRVFLDGYQTAMHDVGSDDVSDPPFQGFHLWVARKFGFYESTAGWPNMVLAITLGLNPKDIDWVGYDSHATQQQLIDATHRCIDLIEEFRSSRS